ncbi:hypothetical protein MLD38_024773 [Melastoma candidum]|uniref:Uncharacterized protein n=1 Tax=Melastoma candidum TaxID=119954 RepID=A0ACB9NT26_9MYRT|nr:hypothetical protein MLD38_024773 [Melastoma candidum]
MDAEFGIHPPHPKSDPFIPRLFISTQSPTCYTVHSLMPLFAYLQSLLPFQMICYCSRSLFGLVRMECVVVGGSSSSLLPRLDVACRFSSFVLSPFQPEQF